MRWLFGVVVGLVVIVFAAVPTLWWALERGYLNGAIEQLAPAPITLELTAAPNLDFSDGMLDITLGPLAIAAHDRSWESEIERLQVVICAWAWLRGERVLDRVTIERSVNVVNSWPDGAEQNPADSQTFPDPLFRQLEIIDASLSLPPTDAAIEVAKLDLEWQSALEIDIQARGTIADVPFDARTGERSDQGIPIRANLGASSAEIVVDPNALSMSGRVDIDPGISSMLAVAGLPPTDVPAANIEFDVRQDAGELHADLHIEAMGLEVAFDGKFAGIRELDGHLAVAGVNPAPLLDRLDLPAVATPPFDLKGGLAFVGENIAFTNIGGTVGDSDMAGDITIDLDAKPIAVWAELASRVLDFDDLAPLIGLPPRLGAGETASAAQTREAAREPGRLIPDADIDPADWTGVDIDLSYKAADVRTEILPIDLLEANVVARSGWLTFDPIVLGLADGRTVAFGSFDTTQRPPAADLDLRIEKFHAGEAMRKLGQSGEAVGVLDGRVKLSGRGYSVAELVGTAQGRAVIVMSDGRIAPIFLEAIGLDLMEGLIALVTADDDAGGMVPIACAVANMEVREGRAIAGPILLDTRDSKVTAEGWIDLGTETIDLLIEAHPKDASLLSGNQPIQIEGAWLDPTIAPAPVEIDNNALAWALAPLAAVLPFFDLGLAEDAPCGSLIAQAKEAAKRSEP